LISVWVFGEEWLEDSDPL